MPADAARCRPISGFLPNDRLANVGQDGDAPAGIVGLGRRFSCARTRRHRALVWAEMPPDPAQRSPCESKAESCRPRLIRTAPSRASTDGDSAAEGPLPACSEDHPGMNIPSTRGRGAIGLAIWALVATGCSSPSPATSAPPTEANPMAVASPLAVASPASLPAPTPAAIFPTRAAGRIAELEARLRTTPEDGAGYRDLGAALLQRAR
jgi:hypothetical protein